MCISTPATRPLWGEMDSRGGGGGPESWPTAQLSESAGMEWGGEPRVYSANQPTLL